MSCCSAKPPAWGQMLSLPSSNSHRVWWKAGKELLTSEGILGQRGREFSWESSTYLDWVLGYKLSHAHRLAVEGNPELDRRGL